MTFKTLVKKVEAENPIQFRLPDDIRLYFAGGMSFQSVPGCAARPFVSPLISTDLEDSMHSHGWHWIVVQRNADCCP
jgi:hypothetical protein